MAASTDMSEQAACPGKTVPDVNSTSIQSDEDQFWDDDTDEEFDDSDVDLNLLHKLKGLDMAVENVASAAGVGKQSGPNAQTRKANTLQPRTHEVQKADRRLNAQLLSNELDDSLESLDGSSGMHSSVMAAVRGNSRRQATGVARDKDKADRATYQTVLDPRTRLVLLKMLNNGLFEELNGCVSTGKEANVYQARTAEGTDLAVKIYKTSVLTFKTRDRYVRGDFRFKSYCKSNPRKMVKVWAEKEFRNLSRLRAAGIRSPEPVQLRMHVLAMEFVGTGGVAAPRLKDARVSLQQLQTFYTQLVLLIRQMYQECHLVHADLSEYNILVHNDELWIIDVSQSVDLDHPRSLQFLREDAAHVNAFFRRAGVATLTTRELFDFAVDPNINAANIDAAVDALIQLASSRPVDLDPEDVVAEKVFKEAYIPRRLEEVDDYEGDFEKLASGGEAAEGIYYQTLAGMRKDMTGAAALPALVASSKAVEIHPEGSQAHGEAASRDGPSAGSVLVQAQGAQGSADNKPSQGGDEAPASRIAADDDGDGDSGSGSNIEADSSGQDSEAAGAWKERAPRDLEAEKADRKAHKAAVKEANREKRKTKLKKHVKKRAIAKHKHK